VSEKREVELRHFFESLLSDREKAILEVLAKEEIKIEEILQSAGLSFKEEYIFDDLISTSGKPLRFDFAIFDDNGDLDFLIEYQGI